MTRPTVGLVLGAGSARGWSHIGVIRALEEMGVPIDVICGCSSGALVAASYAAGRLDLLQRLAETLTQAGMFRFLDLSFNKGGVIEGRWIADFYRKNIGDIAIEDLEIPFGVVATEYKTGREIWFRSGSLIDAVRASIAMPGILAPVNIDHRWMIDGAVVNPIPVTLCRSLGADIIIAVNTGGEPGVKDRLAVRTAPTEETPPASSWLSWLTTSFKGGAAPQPARPSYFEVLGDSIYTMQRFLTGIRLSTDPPDVLISPILAEVSIMEWHKGKTSIAQGRLAVEAAKDRITDCLGQDCLGQDHA